MHTLSADNKNNSTSPLSGRAVRVPFTLRFALILITSLQVNFPQFGLTALSKYTHCLLRQI